MNAFFYDSNGNYVGLYNCQIDPVKTRKEGKPVYLLPQNATFTSPPEYKQDEEIPVWNGENWDIKKIEVDEQPEPTPEPTAEERIAELEAQLAESDEAAIALYEAQAAQEAINAEQDEAILGIYEMIGG